MKSKEKKALHTQTVAELTKLLEEARETLFTMQMDFSLKKLKDTSAIKRKRDEIAKILTVLAERKMINENV